MESSQATTNAQAETLIVAAQEIEEAVSVFAPAVARPRAMYESTLALIIRDATGHRSNRQFELGLHLGTAQLDQLIFQRLRTLGPSAIFDNAPHFKRGVVKLDGDWVAQLAKKIRGNIS